MNSVIQFRGTIYENGYGLIASKVMRDKRLPKQSKLIYAYMCSFAGVDKDGNRSAFPSVSLQCDELGMNETTYYKWRKYLVQFGYITIEKQKDEKGLFDRNLYIIEAVPVEKTADEEKNDPYPKNSRMENECMEKRGTISNSLNSNSFNKEEEEEEESITLDNVISFINEQITKREITNQKTILAIREVAAQCKAIGTSDRKAMQNYCIKVIEEKMTKIGQKQGTNKRTGKAIRTEMAPDWLNKNEEAATKEQPKKESAPISDERKKAIWEQVNKLNIPENN